MVENVASLGLVVDSTQVTTATRALQGLQTAAAPASAAVTALGTASKSANDNLKASTEAVKGAANAHHGLSGEAQSAGHAIRSLIEGLATGMPPTQILSQQIGHLSYAMGGEGGLSGAFSQLGGKVAGFITPLTIAGAGVVGLAAGAAFLTSSIVKSELAIGELSERTQTAVTNVHALETAAAFKGISTEDFTKGITEFNSHVMDARDNIGELSQLLAANGQRASDLSSTLGKVADLVKNAASESEKYKITQEAGLPATRQWVQFLSQGSAGIAAATKEASSFSAVADEALIKRARDFDDAWNKGWANFTAGAKSAAISAIDAFSGLSDKINTTLHALTGVSGNAVLGAAFRGELNGSSLSANSSVDSLYGSIGSLKNAGGAPGAGDVTKDPAAIKAQIALEQQRIGVLGQMATVQDQVRQKEDAITLARLNNVPVTKAQSDALLEYTRNQALGINAIQQQTDNQRIALTTVGMSTSAAEAYRAVQERVNDAVLRGAPLNAQEIAQLREKASVLGGVAQAAQEAQAKSNLTFNTSQLGRTDTEQQVATQLRALYGDNFQAQQNGAIANQIRFNSILGDTKSAAQGALSSFVNDLVQGKGAVAALQTALQGVERKLIDMASNAIISNLFKNLISSGIGSAFGAPTTAVPTSHTGGIIGSDAGPMRSVHPAMFATAPRFHSGGLVSGDVPAVLQSGEGVFTKSQMKAMGILANGGNNNGGGGNSVQVNVHNNTPNSQVETRKSSSGGVDIHDIIISAVGDKMASGSFDGQMRARYATPVKPRGR